MGATAGYATVVCVTLGTGVGEGVVVDGRLAGPHGRAGKLGHQVIDLDGPPLRLRQPGLRRGVRGRPGHLRLGGRDTPEAVFQAAAADDEAGAAAVEVVVDRLAVGIANLVAVLWPERVVVGGGVAAAGDRLFTPLQAAVVGRRHGRAGLVRDRAGGARPGRRRHRRRLWARGADGGLSPPNAGVDPGEARAAQGKDSLGPGGPP